MAHGMRVGYHCHGGDFAKLEGTTPWEAIGENTNADVILQIDVGNCLGGGGDPIAMIKKFPGRTVSIHLKEHGGKPGAVVRRGQDEVEGNLRAVRNDRRDETVRRRGRRAQRRRRPWKRSGGPLQTSAKWGSKPGEK